MGSVSILCIGTAFEVEHVSDCDSW